MTKVKVSVILSVYNEEMYIKECLASIAEQIRIPDEVIVVDDGSNDSSKFKVKSAKLQFKIKNLKLLEQEHQGPAVARNFGASKARGDILVFLDGDMKYDKHFLKEIIRPITEKRAVATFTKEEYVVNLDNNWAKFWDDVTFANSGKRVVKRLGERGITFRAIRASEFWKAGGYDSYGTSDDRSILLKLGKKSKNVPTALCYHYNPSSLSEVFYSARWIGRDTKHSGNLLQFFTFSPILSMFKAIFGTMRRGNIHFLPFRLVFDFGYFMGIIDGRLTKVHYK